MSILITGIDMPTKGNPITVSIYPDGTAEWEAQNKTGTAIAIPLHGRLIDADDAYHILTNYYHHSTELQHYDLREALAKVSTIIPAEKEVEKNFCGDCHWHEAEEQYCFRKGCHTYDESSCELWEPMPADEPIPAPGGKTAPTTYDLLYEEGGAGTT